MTTKTLRQRKKTDKRNHSSNYNQARKRLSMGRASTGGQGESARSHSGYVAVQLLQMVLEVLPPDKKVVILVVEGEPIARNVFSKALTRCGYRVLEAADSEKAISICESAKDAIALLITKITLRDGKGTQLAAKIREHCPNSAVIISSGIPIEYWRKAERESLAYLGERVAVLNKPFPVYALDSTEIRRFPSLQPLSADCLR